VGPKGSNCCGNEESWGSGAEAVNEHPAADVRPSGPSLWMARSCWSKHEPEDLPCPGDRGRWDRRQSDRNRRLVFIEVDCNPYPWSAWR